ncbi:UbiA family prenyltransferase [Natrinema caseinilyticum]|uniref:UbiA family prenyltransferase n=1 Tax=Natrinema caseinilyticum TaxID=2961570 RepID=UPI0020C2EE63|nr:UbiA family prenyltransferase [Natrinema caseinilyticum]
MRDSETGDSRPALGAYAELVRVPNLFTAPPDVILGAAVVSVAGATPSPSAVALLSLGSVFLYAGGTTLNDAFDAPLDARERPNRPIPSGRIDRRTAFELGFALLFVAVGIAFVAAGGPAAVVAGSVAIAILAYDGLLKGSAPGFIAMGATRGLNVVLGATAAGSAALEIPARLVVVPAVVTGYISAVTFMAARESEGDNRRAVAVASGGAVLAVVALCVYLVGVESSGLEILVALAFATAFCWWVGRPLRAAYADPVPSTVGPAVGGCVLGLVLLDAGFAAAAGIRWGVAAGVFLVPAVGLGRMFDVT